MLQEERSERSRGQILDAALKLFAHRGYGATSVRDIAEMAHLSKGNVYHHFPDKEAIFRSLLDQYFEAMARPDHPFNSALAEGTFPENLERLGRGTRDAVLQYREYVSLIYVDVIEFDGSHVRKFYEDMAQRFNRFLEAHDPAGDLEKKLADGLSPTSAVMLATRIFFNYFSIEIIFGVRDHFGKSTDEVIGEISRILRHGMLKQTGAQPALKARATKAVPAPRKAPR